MINTTMTVFVFSVTSWTLVLSSCQEFKNVPTLLLTVRKLLIGPCPLH
jgi:hypothetical protein